MGACAGVLPHVLLWCRAGGIEGLDGRDGVGTELSLWQWSFAFVVSGAVLVRAGVTLARAGDDVAEMTGLGRLFVGVLFLALATSLPEIVTDVTAAAVGSPDLAVGDLFGSSMANMAILAVVDLVARRRVWPSVEVGQARVASVAIALTAIATLGILSPPKLRLGWVGVDTMVVAASYFSAAAWFHRLSRSSARARADGHGRVRATTRVARPGGRAGEGALRASALRFASATVAILVSAPVVALSARHVAREAGIAETTVGTGLLAVTTSLPELITSLAAVRIGAHDLAVGNLFGSNAMNMSVLVLVDAVYTDGPVLAAVDPAQAVGAVGAILLMALALAAIVGGTEARLGRVEPDALLVLIGYLVVLAAVGVAA